MILRRRLLESLQHRQNRNELRKRLRMMHAADVAYVLESLSLGERRLIWDELEPQQAGWVLVELPGTIQAGLTEATSRERLVEVLATLDVVLENGLVPHADQSRVSECNRRFLPRTRVTHLLRDLRRSRRGFQVCRRGARATLCGSESFRNGSEVPDHGTLVSVARGVP